MTPDDLMAAALAAAATVRTTTSPNPWVGCAIECADGSLVTGATQPAGGPHAERVALDAAGERARGGRVAVTLEPCDHHGRTPPCTDALVAAGVTTVFVGVGDTDARVRGAGIAALRRHGIEVVEGVRGEEASSQLAPYLHHRRTGRPYVVVKLAATLDGRTAAADGSSKWITGDAARADVHRLRAESDAVLVGAGTVRADDPALTVREADGTPAAARQPRRIVLGRAPVGARVHPCTEMSGPLDDVLARLGDDGVLQVLVEGGARLAGDFHRQGLVDRYVIYLAPALAGGDDGAPLFGGPGAPTVHDLWRGRIVRTTQLGVDLRIDLVP